MPEQDSMDWKESILSTMKQEGDDKESQPLLVKKLRKKVLRSLSLDDSDKNGKKSFKKAMKTLEEEGAITIDAEGTVTLVSKPKKRKKDKKEKKDKKDKKEKKDKKKKQKTEEAKTVEEEDGDGEEVAEKDDNGEDEPEKEMKESTSPAPKTPKTVHEACPGNPGGVTRVFLGNLPFSVDEKTLCEFLPQEVTHIKWITDKETGKFYGSAFVEMDTPSAAAQAVAMAGQTLADRPIKINFAPARPGDIWPPAAKVVLGGAAGGGPGGTTTGGSAGGKGAKALGPKPENCLKLFIGNLSYDIDDETITKFFDNVGAEVKAVRWLSHKDTGDFKGCGFVEFWKTEACEKAATLNGKTLLGRPIRIDWSD